MFLYLFSKVIFFLATQCNLPLLTRQPLRLFRQPLSGLFCYKQETRTIFQSHKDSDIYVYTHVRVCTCKLNRPFVRLTLSLGRR